MTKLPLKTKHTWNYVSRKKIRASQVAQWQRIRLPMLEAQETRVNSWVGNGNPLQNPRLENPHGQMSLAGYSPWGHKESETTERLSVHAFQKKDRHLNTVSIDRISSPRHFEGSSLSSHISMEWKCTHDLTRSCHGCEAR